MKIVMIFDGPQLGGIGKANLDLADAFIKLKHEVVLLLRTADGPRASCINSAAKIYVVGHCKAVGIVKYTRWVIRKEKPKLIIVTNIMPGILAVAANRLAGSTALVTIVNHINILRNIQDSEYPKKKKWLFKFLLPKIVGDRVKLISLTKEAQSGLARLANVRREDVNVIYNPIVINNNTSIPDVDILEWWREGGLQLIILGRLDPLKDIATALRAVALIIDLDPRLLIVGTGPEIIKLREQCSQLGLDRHVRFSGFILYPGSYIEEADILLSASMTESFSLTLAEGLCAGVQVVATDCEFGPKEVLGQNQWGRLVPVGDDISMALAIRNVVTYPIDPEVLKLRGREFFPEKIASQFLTLASDR